MLSESETEDRLVRRLRIGYLILTLGLFLPLFWAFVRVRNLYPIASWNVMVRSSPVQPPYTYYILRGETDAGDLIDVQVTSWADPMRSRLWGLVAATANNQSLKLQWPHPKNAALLSQLPVDQLPEGVLMNDLLRVWGQTYNATHPAGSPYHLKVMQLEAYRWDGASYSDYRQFVRSWRAEL
jgi:hypothetical protein